MHLLTRLSCFFTALLLTTAALADSGYFDPISEDKQAVLEQIFAETGVPLSKVTLYKVVSDLKREGEYLKAIVQIRKKVGDEYVWADDKGREKDYQNIIGGLRKKPNAVIKNDKIISLSFTRINEPLEHASSLSEFKYLFSIAFFARSYCSSSTIKTLPKLNYLEYGVFFCKKNTAFPDLTKFPNLTSLMVINSDLSNASIPVNNKIKIAYIEPSKGLKNLNQIRNLTQVEDLSIIMRSVKSEQETITDLSWLAQLPQLKKLRLMLYRQPVKDLSFLKSLKNLKSLYISSRQAEYIPLGELTQLESLKLVDIPATSLPGLEKLQQLKTLDIFAHKISELPGLEKLTQLESIKLQMHRLYKLPSLKKLNKLKILKLYETKIDRLDFLQDSISLEVLEVSFSPVHSMKPVALLKNLKTLEFMNTQVTKIEGLENKKSLENLLITETTLLSMDGLKSLGSLTLLNLNGTKISQLSGVDKLKKLKSFFVPEFRKTPENLQYLKKLEKNGVLLIF